MSATMSERMVIVVGAINVDLVVAAPRLPGPGETVVGDGLQTFGGGKGANAAVAAARAGATVRLIGAVGDDDTGAAALAELRNEGVDVSDVAVLAGESTGVALIVVDDRGENQIAVGAGANAAITADHINRCIGSALPSAGCVLVSTEIPPVAIAAAVEAATAAGVVCLLNPAPVIPVVVELLSRGPIVTPNGSELHDLTTLLGGNGAASPEEAASRVAAVSRQPVVVTQGADGVLLITSDSIRRVRRALRQRARHDRGWRYVQRGVGRTLGGGRRPHHGRALRGCRGSVVGNRGRRSRWYADRGRHRGGDALNQSLPGSAVASASAHARQRPTIAKCEPSSTKS